MNVESPRCRRCDGTRFFHVSRMRDAAVPSEDDAIHNNTSWRERPVRLVGSSTAPVPVGHFDTLVCRRCGLTEWFARQWQPESVRTRPVPCVECNDTTPHALLAAVEHVWAGFEQPRITHGMLGREGFLETEICTRCDRVGWRGLEYRHLDRTHFVRYRLADEHDRRCLRCGDHAAILDDQVREAEGVTMPIAMREPGVLARFFGITPLAGSFQLRLCKPCGGVEWYGRGLDKVKPSADVRLVGETPEMVSLGGPYR